MSTLVQAPIVVPDLQKIVDRPTYTAIRFLGDQVGRLTRGGFSGSLSPDQRPLLGIKDAGTQFFSTDFARGYQWTGSAWQDLPDAPSRFQVVLFGQSPEPPIGWAPCDGRNVTRSTSSAGVAFYKTPQVPLNTGLLYWVRL